MTNNANRLALPILPLVIIGLSSIMYFIGSCVVCFFESKQSPSWDAATCFICCYGFLYVGLNQLNIHTETFNKK